MGSRYGEKVERFYHSMEWKRCRNVFVVFKRGVCDICGRRGNMVHHKLPLNEVNVEDPMIALNFDNLQLLCHDCHEHIHSDIDSGRADKPTITEFTPNGDVIVRDKKQQR